LLADPEECLRGEDVSLAAVNCAASKKEAAELLELQRDLRAVSKATTGVSLAPPSAFF